MRTVFADTSYFIAMLCADDEMHEAAVSLQGERLSLVTTEWVMAELAAYLSDPGNRELFTRTLAAIRCSPSVELLPATHETFAAGVLLYAQRADKQWSLTDCISFNVMRDSDLKEALTSDRHFEQAGFVAMMK